MSSTIAALRDARNRINSSPAARIYTFRAVLLSTIISVVVPSFWVYEVVIPVLFNDAHPLLLPIVCICLPTIFHHISMLCPWRINLAIVDILLVKLELVGFCIVFSYTGIYRDSRLGPVFAANIVTLSFSLYFRYVGYTRGRFNLFGGCYSAQPLYNSWEILFGRSALRPLVRGEFRAIAFLRAIILVFLCFAIPACAVYLMFLVPFQALVMTRNINTSARSWFLEGTNPWGNDGSTWFMPAFRNSSAEMITLILFNSPYSNAVAINVTVARTFQGNATQGANVSMQAGFATPVMSTYSWLELVETRDGLIVSAHFSDPTGILYVKPGEGDPSDVNLYADVIPLTAGSHLSAILSRRQRDVFSKNAQDLLGITTPFRSIYLNPVLLLQPDPFPPDKLGPNAASLRLFMRDDMQGNPAEIVQDYTNASVLNGLATFGGFWTFVNGAFAMVFGANLLYFLFRRRSLSALGIVHIFQRRRLIRNWNEDFPALHTEGGQPGSNSAGIVAFLRERLVDLDDEDSHSGDLEAQHSSSGPVHPVALKNEPDALNPPVDSISTEVDPVPNTV